jgi:hypothetical protein
MIIRKEIQKKYAEALRNNDIKAFTEIYTTSQSRFSPMYLVSHGLLSSDALSGVSEEMIEKTIKLWDLTFLAKGNTLFSWLYLKGFNETRKTVVWIFKYGVSQMPMSDHLLLISPLEKNRLATTYPFSRLLHLIPKDSVESSGKNYFLWLIKYGTLTQIKDHYVVGSEFLEDEDGTKLLCYLPNSKMEIREWLFDNTDIVNDPLFKQLGIPLTKFSFLPRPWKGPLFDFTEPDLKKSLGVKSRLIVETLKDRCRFPVSKGGGADHQITLDFFNAVFLIKKEIPDIDENILNNVLKKVLTQNWSIEITELPSIIKIVWNTLNQYSVARRLKLILTANISLSSVVDIERMIKTKVKAANEFKIKLLPKKPKFLYYIHAHLAKIPELLSENRTLNSKYAHVLNESESDGLKIKYPVDEVDIIKIGIDLNICVGSEYYRERAVKGECDIFAIIENNKIAACVEVVNRLDLIVIEQVSGEENKAVDEKFNKFILAVFKEKVPDKYISFYFRSEDDNY